MAQTVVLKVGMSCQGCVGAVNRVLGKMEGVESFDIDLKEQKVTVKGNVHPDEVLQTVSKTGKKTSFWEAEAKGENVAKPDSAEAVVVNGAKPASVEAVAVKEETPASVETVAVKEEKPASVEAVAVHGEKPASAEAVVVP
ncbi:copper transport protein ATX1-like isoform X1 [Telopea speciosissima]|uniref:copper transport protein ATX1-like isoform X1 n=2 Tax=Telopea speciosissima TaxID=54955 RepID=UPI001CC33F68|nr:copper transport protein ATX1-like isoform X1 [Telopea speciosissima]XP_043699799.1 copper transport protein ATX1-like isoform X1 [Telopea speciosissima]